jgi:hypothetical protein
MGSTNRGRLTTAVTDGRATRVVMRLGVAIELVTGLTFLIIPGVVIRALIGADEGTTSTIVGRVLGGALVGLGIASGVPSEWIEKYRGKFDDGYDQLRDRILARQKELGIVPADTTLAPWPEVLPSWDDLTDLDKKVGARWMEVFCAAVEHTDYQVGRIIEAIQQTGELDDTLIIYIADDNGPTPEGASTSPTTAAAQARAVRARCR